MGHFTGVDYKAIAKQNSKNIDTTVDGGRLEYAQSLDVVVIGDGHSNATVDWMNANHRSYFSGEGDIVVTKGKGTDPGTLAVSGLLVEARKDFKTEVGRFSKKRIVFV
jgi:hypothetical protein